MRDLAKGSLTRSHLEVLSLRILLISFLIVSLALVSPVPAYFKPIARTQPPMMLQ